MGRWARLSMTAAVAATAVFVVAAMLPAGSSATIAEVTVLPGESLWSIAGSVAPDRDPRVVIEEILALNGLTSSTVQRGVILRVPIETGG